MIGDRPVLWHIMKGRSVFGIKDFVLALGEYAELIRDFFVNYQTLGRNVEVRLATGEIKGLTHSNEEDWTVKLIETGVNAGTGCRIARCRPYLGDQSFLLTYADCLCSVHIDALLQFHRKHNKLLTITGVQPVWRYGVFNTRGGVIQSYTPKSQLVSQYGYINGGYMIAEPAFLNYVEPLNECVAWRRKSFPSWPQRAK